MTDKDGEPKSKPGSFLPPIAPPGDDKLVTEQNLESHRPMISREQTDAAAADQAVAPEAVKMDEQDADTQNFKPL